MYGRLLSAVAVVAALAVLPAGAVAATRAGQTITATGTGQAPVKPANRKNNASIVAAVDAAHVAAIGGALNQAHEYASDYAKSVGMTLGPIQAVTDVQQNGFYGPGVFFGPFGPNQYCGTISRIVGRPVRGKRPKFRKVHRCFVPGSSYTTLTVTYSAS